MRADIKNAMASLLLKASELDPLTEKPMTPAVGT
jgi:hypothetical protein